MPWTGVERRQPLRPEPTRSRMRALKGAALVTLVALETAWLTVLAYAARALVV